MNPTRKLVHFVLFGLLILGSPTASASSAPQNAAPLSLEGNRYLQEGKYDQAILEYEKILTKNALQPEIYFNLAIAYYAEGKMTKAAQALEKLLILDPTDVEARYNLACLNLYLKNPEKAKFHFLKAKRDARHTPAFIPLIHQGLQFLKGIKQADPQSQDILFSLLKFGLPSLPLAS
jgi:tetratricopeptide (TPR) repeat protein